MMKAVLTILLAFLSMTVQGQTYEALWKQVKEAEAKDLPRTQYDVLMKIVAKAQREGQYGQLMAAELAGSRVMTEIAPDSLQPAVERMEKRYQKVTDKALATVYAVVLRRIYQDNSQLEKTNDLTVTLDAETCEKLAAVKAGDYKPLTVNGRDSRWFDDDMLSVVGYELKSFRPLHDYYEKAGNRVATMMTALEIAKQEKGDYGKADQEAYLARLDSLIGQYGDLPECGEVSIERYNCLEDYQNRHHANEAPNEVLWKYLEQALNRWGSYKRMDVLRNKQMELTRNTFQVNVYAKMVQPGVAQKVGINGQPVNLKNISQLTMRIYRAKVNGNVSLNPENEKDYKTLKPLLTELPELRVTRQYSGHKTYEWFTDSIEIPGLPVGVYLIEMESTPATAVSRKLYFVSNLRTLTESLPGNQMRYVVVDALEGQPVKGASVELSGYVDGRNYQKIATLTTDAKGEATYTYNKERPTSVFTYTATDKACLPTSSYNRFSYYDSDRRVERTQLFTDRAIYRPGQTVHVAAISYVVENGFKQRALEGNRLTLTLRDANYKVVAEQEVTTDRYGSCAADFTLPTGGLTGSFSVQTYHGNCYFRVEEYKRPTFEVEFEKVTTDYKDGDTLTVKGTARSFAGVPVQGAAVKYRVMRRRSYWWWYWGYTDVNDNDEEVASGSGITGDDGTFTVQMPMNLPKTAYPMFYNFVCMADVTDQAGETHRGELSLPLGNRKTAFNVDMPDQIRADQAEKMTFHLRNAAGNDIDAIAKYQFDNGKWLTAKTNSPFPILQSPLKSGKHTLEAICQGDTVKKEFVVFSLDDRRPAAETDSWFYQSDSQFPNDGRPVTIQVGSSAKNVHIVYSVISGERVIESASVDLSNELINRKLTYKEEYGNGVLLTYAWVKNGKTYTHSFTIERPLPDKRLMLAWSTFRDRLTPGQQEEWSLTVKNPDGTPADAQLMATLYDKSLDQIVSHNLSFSPYLNIQLPRTTWQFGSWGGIYLHGDQALSPISVKGILLTHFDSSLFPQRWMGYRNRLFETRAANKRLMAKGLPEPEMLMAREIPVDMKESEDLAMNTTEEALQGRIAGLDIVKDAEEQQPEVQMRENLQETAFFYPRLQADSTGLVTMKFTLPESLTTWRFIGLAHTPDLCYGKLEGEAVAKKDLMVQPNMPRFVREGDQATISARVINASERDLSGMSWLTLIDPETEKTVLTLKEPFTVKAGATTSVIFPVSPNSAYPTLLIAKVSATTDGFSDGEQHYLPVLPSRERVTVTVPFTQNEPGTKTIDLTKFIPAGVSQAKLTMEYTNNPAWLMIQALPAVGHPNDDCAICQAASLYANTIGKHIVDQVPQAKSIFEQWKRETGDETSLHSQLQKNQELKDLVLNETPWVADADREQEQRHRLADFFDENTMRQRISSALDKLGKLQRGDGSWSWWPDMPGSTYMTMSVAEMMVRQNSMMGEQEETKDMLRKAFKFLGKEMVEIVDEMKKREKKGFKPYFPGNIALEWLYICKLDGRQLSSDVQKANEYLIKLLKKETLNQTIYQKAISAIVLESPTYIKSLKEYTVYKEEMGRYYDTPRAGYSWRDYRIPTQVAAIEAIQRLTPNDQQTLDEMRRWLLQEKRTQAWDTPLNSVDAVYAFLSNQGMVDGNKLITAVPTALKLDGKAVETPKATAGIGYVKTAQQYQGEKIFTAEKTSEGTSWGAVYAQFMQQTSDIKDVASGISVKRELLTSDGQQLTTAKIGERIKVRLTITSERDLDFVQLQDKRAACMEPVKQLSGYNWSGGYYCTPRDNVTNYYFDRLPKGKRVIETDYYIDRAGQYETGTCTVQCAYASEYRGTTHSVRLKVED